jgi:8-oxo-dGTP pyrophosphatase MutT (NUDIX family)
LEQLIATTWDAQVAEADKHGRILFNGDMGGLIRWRDDGDAIVLDVRHTDYRRFIGTNFCNGPRAGAFGVETYANPVGTSAVLIAADGNVLFGRRGMHLACHGGYLHIFGGSLEPIDRREDGTVDVFEAVRRELREELHVTDEEIAELVCTGMVRDLSLFQPELCYDAVLKIGGDEVLSRFDPDAPGQEHSALEIGRDDPQQWVHFIRGAVRFAPAAVGAVMLHGRRVWGLAWYDRSCRLLFGGPPPSTAEVLGELP